MSEYTVEFKMTTSSGAAESVAFTEHADNEAEAIASTRRFIIDLYTRQGREVREHDSEIEVVFDEGPLNIMFTYKNFKARKTDGGT